MKYPVLLLIIFMNVDLFSQTRTWDGGAGTLNFSDAANWNPDGVPGPTDEAILDFGDTVEIVGGTHNVKYLNMTSSTVLTLLEGTTLNVDGATNSGFDATGSNSKIFNHGTINISNTGYYGLVIYGSFTNFATGVVDISTTDNHGIIIATNDTLYNYGEITITGSGFHGISNTGSIYNYVTGEIHVVSPDNNGIRNGSYDFLHNYGLITIDAAMDEGLYNSGFLFNYSDAAIRIQNGVKSGFENTFKVYNEQGALILIDTVGGGYQGYGFENGNMDSLFNAGQLVILGAADDGIYNNGHIQNEPSGTISIINAGRSFPGYGVYTLANKSCLNAGTIEVHGSSENGIENQGITTNLATGIITINDAGGSGLLNSVNDKIFNYGTITISDSNENGLRNYGTLTNGNGGVLQIHNSGLDGYRNEYQDTTFNYGMITIDTFGRFGMINLGWIEITAGKIEAGK